MWAAILLACLALSLTTTARADDKVTYKPGAECKRKTDDFRGIIKLDACGRVYCGRADVKDIKEIDPTLAERMQCSWRLVEDHCKCVKNQ